MLDTDIQGLRNAISRLTIVELKTNVGCYDELLVYEDFKVLVNVYHADSGMVGQRANGKYTSTFDILGTA